MSASGVNWANAQVLALCAGLLCACAGGAPPPRLDADPVFAPVSSQTGTQYVPMITYKNPAHGSVIRDKLRASPDLAGCQAELAKAAARPLTGGLAGAGIRKSIAEVNSAGAATAKAPAKNAIPKKSPAKKVKGKH